jgi:predicted MPP superfamily phosphohydrolase
MPATQAPLRPPARILTRRNFLIASAATVAGVALYSNDIARHELEVTHPTFFLKDLPPAFDGFRIAQISDLHLEEYTEDYFLTHVINRVNALKPDMVLVTGDFVSRTPLSPAASFAAAGRCAELLAALTCPTRYGCLGNHDFAVGPDFIRNHMEANGLPLLINQFVPIERNGQRIFLGGLDDVAYGRPNINLATPDRPDEPVLIMAHEPDFAAVLAKFVHKRRIDLILSGHTHGGQIRLPGIRPLALPPWGKLFPEGHFVVGRSQLYVNRGIGTVGVPFRLNCVPEITLATLRPAASESKS